MNMELADYDGLVTEAEVAEWRHESTRCQGRQSDTRNPARCNDWWPTTGRTRAPRRWWEGHRSVNEWTLYPLV